MKSHKVLNSSVFFQIIFVLFFATIFAMPLKADTQKETVKVGFFELNGFFNMDDSDHLFGYGIEYFNQIAENTNWNIEYVKYESWVDALQNFEKGNIDILSPSQMTSERLEKFLFCAYPMGNEYGSILTLNTNKTLIYEDFEKFNTLKIGCVPSLVFLNDYKNYEKEHNFSSNLFYYKDTQTLVAALNAGEVDAIIANLMVKTPTMKVLAQFGASSFYAMVHKNDYNLKNKLDFAVKNIKSSNPTFETSLIEKYFKTFFETPLSKKEFDYVNKSGSFNVGYVPNDAPISYSINGEPKGITIELLKKISDFSGLQFNLIELPVGLITYSFLRDNKIDIVTNVEYNSQNVNSAGLKLSNPYLKAKKVFVMKNGKNFFPDNKYTLAIATGSGTLQQIINKEYPNMQIQVYNTVQECFDAVKAGKADLLMQNQYVVEPYLSKPKYNHMSVVPVVEIEDQLCMSLIVNQNAEKTPTARLSAPELISILNKSIAHIEQDETSNVLIREIILNQYKYTITDFIYLYRLWIIVFTFIILFLLFIAYKVQRLKNKSSALIAKSEQKLRHITNNINGGVVVLEPNQGLRITYANNGFLNLIGLTRQEYEAKKDIGYVAFVHPGDIEKLNKVIAESKKLNSVQQISTELRLKKCDGNYIQALFNGTLANEDQNKQVLYCVILDISLQVKLTEELQFSQKRYETLMDQTGDIIYEINLQTGKIVTSNQFLDKFGWSLPEFVDAKSSSALIDIWHIASEDISKLIKSTEKVISKGKANTCEIKLLKKDNTQTWCELFQFPMTNKNGQTISIVGRITDINEQIHEREILQEKSRRDALTNLYTKIAFHELASLYLLQEPKKSSAVIFTDLDHFKQVNDTLGHLVGDQAIIDATHKIQTIFSNIDIISRFGGDEFCILVKDIEPTVLIEKLSWMLEKLKAVYSDDENNCVSITCSIGVAFTTDCGTDIKTLTSCADKALYKAKENGRNQYVIYNSSMN